MKRLTRQAVESTEVAFDHRFDLLSLEPTDGETKTFHLPIRNFGYIKAAFWRVPSGFSQEGFAKYPLVKGKACPQMPVTYYGSWWLLCTIKRAQTSCLLAACHLGGRRLWEGGSEGSRAFTLPCELSFWAAYACCKGSAWAQISAHTCQLLQDNKFSCSVYMDRTWVCVLACGKNTLCIALILFLPKFFRTDMVIFPFWVLHLLFSHRAFDSHNLADLSSLFFNVHGKVDIFLQIQLCYWARSTRALRNLCFK